MDVKRGKWVNGIIFFVLTVLLLGSAYLQSQVGKKATIDNDEISYVYDSYLISKMENPLSAGSTRGFGMWYLLAPWTAAFGITDFYTLKLFSVLLTIASEIVIFLIFWRLKQPLLGLLGVFLYGFSPYVVVTGMYLHTQNVQILFLLSALLGYIVYRQSSINNLDSNRKSKELIPLFLSGLALGYAFITRENAIFHIVFLSAVIIFFENLSFRRSLLRISILLIGSGIIVLGNFIVISQSVGPNKVMALYERFTDSTTGVTAGSVLTNVTTIASMMHWPYTIDLLLLAVFGLWMAVVLLIENPTRKTELGSVFQKMSTPQFLFLIIAGIALFMLLTTSLNRYKSFLRSDCYADITSSAYCPGEKVQSIVATSLVAATSFIGIYAIRRRSKNIANSMGDLELIAALFLLLPVTLSYLKHVRFTSAYFIEFYPGVVILALFGVRFLIEKKMIAPIILMIFLLAVGYRASWLNMFDIPMSGSYNYEDIEELKSQVSDIFPNKTPKIFTASTTIAHTIGGESLVNTSHPISYGAKLPDSLKYRLYPRPEVFKDQLMAAGCDSMILIDLLTKQSYFWNDNPLQLYIEESYAPVYVLSSESRTKLLMRKDCVDSNRILSGVDI